MPVAELSALARAHGCIAVVDGAQAVGAIDVNVKQLGCHAYATSGHKWLLAPKGTGLLYLSTDLAARIDPIALQGGRAAYTAASGVCSIPSVHGLAAAVEYHTRLGKDVIERHNLELRAQLLERLMRVPQVRVVSAAAGPLASPLLTYVLPDRVKAGELQRTRCVADDERRRSGATSSRRRAAPRRPAAAGSAHRATASRSAAPPPGARPRWPRPRCRARCSACGR